MKSKAIALILVLSSCVASGLWAAPQAVLQSLKGKVEVKVAGTKVWAPATEGQVLLPSTALATGFDSSVVVVIDKTTIQVKPLTRMTIDKLVEESGIVKTTTFLRVGSVSASVKSAEGVKQDFKVQSPYSTASVRGTKFDFDGLHLKVEEGVVALILGRPKRETQPAEETEGNTTETAASEGDTGSSEPAAAPEDEATDDDFAGAPDVEANEDEAVLVPAGKSATVKIDFNDPSSRPRSTGSNDKESLEKDSGTGSGSAPKPGQAKVPTKGGVKLTIEFAKTQENP